MTKVPDENILACSVAQIGAMIQRRAVDPEEVTERCLAAIRTCDDAAIFTRVLEQRAMREARASSKRLRSGTSRGLLDGVPVCWKDLFDLEGVVTKAGSRMLDGSAPAAQDAAVVKRLKAAGMVSVGRVNLSEFAFSGLGLNPHFGTPRNPHGDAVARVPGGSSSGSGVAVARGLTSVSIGTDTGGSIRVPASFNGIVGLKTSRGRYSLEGVFPLAPSLDTVGILCRTVDDAIVVDAAIRGVLGAEPIHAALGDTRVLVPDHVVLDDCEPAVIDNFEASLAALSDAGFSVVRWPFPEFQEMFDLFERIAPLVSAEAFFIHRERLKLPGHSIDRRVVSRIERGAGIGAADYMALLAARSRMIRNLSDLLGPRTFVAFPTTPHVAPAIAAVEADDAVFHRVNLKSLRNTVVGNFLDWCGVSLPNGVDEAGMPTALLLSGGPGMDGPLLAFARTVESLLAETVV